MPEDVLYNRQQQLELSVPPRIAVVGVGGIGSWVSIYAAMSGVSEIIMYDPDDLEEHNRNRLPFCSGGIGRPKVHVVSEYIKAIRPDCRCVPITEKCSRDDIRPLLDNRIYWLIECTDSPRSQIELYNACKDTTMKFIRAGYDGTRVTVTSHVSGWIQPEEQETYTVAPSWVVPASVVAALAVGKMCKWQTQEVSLDISEIGIPVLQRRGRVTARCATTVTRS